MKKGLIISAIASNQGKTLLTMALLHHYKTKVRPFKCGPDFIDPQFHEKIANTPSINLDGYMLNPAQLQWIFQKYMDKEVAIIEGVMGYYDGMDKNASAYDIAKILQIPSLILLDASGSYITLCAILQGLKTFQKDNTIKGVIFNKCSSQMHYELIKKHIQQSLPDIKICGWIQKDLPTLQATHLGLDLKELEEKDIAQITQEVLEHIDFDTLESFMDIKIQQQNTYPFPPIQQKKEVCVVVKDKNFSFLYYDNLQYLKEVFQEVILIDSTQDQTIPKNADIVIIPGGYVETNSAYNNIKNSIHFQTSLIQHAKTKKIYAECAGLIYLGQNCDEKKMSGILPISFTLGKKRKRLGYYQCNLNNTIIKGHAFHYTSITKAPKTDIKLYKTSTKMAKDGGYRYKNIFATYLHTMWRVSKITI